MEEDLLLVVVPMARPAVAVAVPHLETAKVSVQDRDVVSCLGDCLSEVESVVQEGTCPTG